MAPQQAMTPCIMSCEIGRAACEPVRPGADVSRPVAVGYEGSGILRWPLVVCMSARSQWIRGLVGMLVASCAAACTNSDTITLGAVLQLSGKLAPIGRTYRDAYQFAVDRINERGGVTLGEFRYKLALTIRDNDSDTNRGVQLHEQLIDKDRVNFLLGGYSSSDVLAGAAAAERYRVVMVQGGGASSRIFTRGYRYVFG